MKSLWNNNEVAEFSDDPLQLRVYASRLLGREPSLVLHGGGNTSVKTVATDMFGDKIETLYVKGSGWDLATIETAGFAPVRMNALLKLAVLDELSDTDMVRALRSAMLDPVAPNPSVETILHALVPFQYVDHTHADAVVTITNTPDGEARIRDLYGDHVLVVPYVMPGFILAKVIRDLTFNVDWDQLEGMVLLHHGVFTFADDAQESYERMIRLVSRAEDYLETHAPVQVTPVKARESLVDLARLRRTVSMVKGKAMVARWDTVAEAVDFSCREDAIHAVVAGTMTPDHVIRTKPAPLIVGDDIETSVDSFAGNYRDYFNRHTVDQPGPGTLTCLDAAPRWAIWPGHGCVSFGRSVKEAGIVADIAAHTRPAVLRAGVMGGWTPVTQEDLFDIEYWELEQAKLKKGGGALLHQGKVALVTGAASGIGKACVETLCGQGAAVVALDMNPVVADMFPQPAVLGLVCDVTDGVALKAAVDETVRRFGGMDIVISNAGIFPPSRSIDEMDTATWDKSMAVNLTSHQQLLTYCTPYLALGMDAAVVIIASKNVPAPGPGAAAYSVAKAGLTQLGRVAALEMASQGIRVNMLHPNAVFDTAIWTDEVLASRAGKYGLSVEEYRTNNLLGVEVTSRHVAELASAMAGSLFTCTTGAQLSVDGGNERVV
ncbi:MAG: bifunctional aldolase/short-chain dehydrogenase [Mariprofundaceae bacterium]|nr:bifunctional aldolase/short-chain dehydrogenase [Mariprofundaceae bacterium]